MRRELDAPCAIQVIIDDDPAGYVFLPLPIFGEAVEPSGLKHRPVAELVHRGATKRKKEALVPWAKSATKNGTQRPCAQVR